MDRYLKVEKPKAETPINENELRITAIGRMRNYISYAITLLQKRADEIVLKAAGRAINKTVMIAELIKEDCWPSSEHIDRINRHNGHMGTAGRRPSSPRNHVSIITITLSKKGLDSSSIGYQPPIPAVQVKPSAEFEDNEGGTSNGGIVEHRNEGMGWWARLTRQGRAFQGRERGYGGGNMQRDLGYYNGNGPSGPLPAQGRAGRGQGKGRGRDHAQGFISAGPFQKGA